MSRNKNKHADKIVNPVAVAPTPQEENYMRSPSIIVWLLSTLLFCLFTGTIAPLYISLGNGKQAASTDTLHKILGVIGICAYLIVPVYLTVFNNPEEDEKPNKRSGSSGKSSILLDGQGLIASIINTALSVIIGLPVMALTFFKPVLRALILLTSFSYLGLPGGESRLFVIIVMSDILLFYINMIFPKWGINPAEIAAVAFRIKKRPLLLNIGTVFYIFYTALIYFFISSIGYNKEPWHHYVKGEREVLLIGSWVMATIFTRLPFIINAIDGIDIIGYLKKMPGRYLIFQIAILVISFIAYMWPYFMGWR
ncbi:MAG: hypothetical protein ABI685_04505 [Ferruginibacter sp.]